MPAAVLCDAVADSATFAKRHHAGKTNHLCTKLLWLAAAAVSLQPSRAETDKANVADCRCWAAQGQCDSNSVFMLPNCAQSCKRQTVCDELFKGDARNPADLENELKASETRVLELQASMEELRDLASRASLRLRVEHFKGEDMQHDSLVSSVVPRRRRLRPLEPLEFSTEPAASNGGESSPMGGSESSQSSPVSCSQLPPVRMRRAMSLGQTKFSTEPIKASDTTASFRMAGLDNALRPKGKSSGYNDSEMDRRSPGASGPAADIRQGFSRRKSWSGLCQTHGPAEPAKEIASPFEDAASSSSPSSSKRVSRRIAPTLSAGTGYADADLPPSPPKLPARFARSIAGLTRSMSLGSPGTSPKARRPQSAGSLGCSGPMSPSRVRDSMRSAWEPLDFSRLDAGMPASPRATTGGWVGRAITKRPSRSALI
eukprot:TRINITY_DN12922_c0_g1_i1.p1 TRINITY_DN12922_c0_g1~~TRINITY_DN12922_c0_g1_i1.p1  ORF type:complete len:429 (+),score=71.68 TRINITY_DN12922_c0_g1_i1:28-1314(+)